ncbi:MAG: phage tail tape measure protein [Oscillospiraceae bacterium]|nr:phage tail tape measure protein [Oscillospiraceae bacterium]
MADQKGMKIRFEADDSKLSSSLNRIESEAKKLTKSLKEIDRYLEFDPSNITLLTQKHDILTKSIENTTQKLQAMESSQEKITAGYQNWLKNKEAVEATDAAIAELRKQQTELNKAVKEARLAESQNLINIEELHEAEKAYGAVQNKIRELQAEKKKLAGEEGLINEASYQRYITSTEGLRINLQQLKQQQAQVSAVIEDGGRSAEEAARKAEAQAKAEAELETATRRAAEAEKQATQTANDYKGALDKLKTAANNVKNDIQGMATAVATGVTAIGGAVAAGTTAVAKTGMEFTKSMSNVQALSGATAEELKELRDAASEAGANTSKSASESADALGFMALAGWDTQQMLEGLMPILRASEAGAMDLATCSDLVTDSMSAMGIAVGDLQHYLDVCAKTQSSANTSMEELLEAYVDCGGILNQLNVPLETSATLLGTLANRGIKGSEAGKSLNAILVNLIGANKNAASAMADMGISAFDAQGRFIGLDETLKLVKSKLDEYGDDTERITQLEAKLGGKTQLDTLMALLSGVSTEYDTLNGKIQDCNGALETTAKTMQDNLSGDITSLKSALEGVENTIFNSLEAPFRDAAQNVTKELRDLNAACSEGELADSLKRSAEALSGFISQMAAFAADTTFPTLIKWLEWVANHADAIISAIKGMGAAWASWKIMQYATHLQELVSAINLVKTASAASAAAQNALAVSGASAAASEEALAAAAKTMASAQMLGYAALIAVTAALASFIAKQIDAASENLSQKNQLDETTQAIYDQANAYSAAQKAMKEQTDEVDKNAEEVKGLWLGLKDLVDEEGRAKGSTKDLEVAVANLNRHAGTNIEVVNGQIQGYKDLAASMDDVLERSRRDAKMSYMQGNYDEAIFNLEETTAKYEQALEDKKAAYEDYNKKITALREAEARGYSEDKPYVQLLEEAEAAGDRLSEVEIQYASLASLKNQYEKTKEEYEKLLTEPLPSEVVDNPAKVAAEAEAKRLQEEARKNAELVKLGVKQTWEELETSLADLDSELAIKNVSEDDFWAERRRLLEESQYKESADWWKYYDEVTEHYEKLSETEQKAQEAAYKEQQSALKDSIDDQISLVKEKQELDNSYTKEMMYNDMETIISGLDKESELYKKYNSEILKGRRALADESSKAVIDKQKDTLSEVENLLKQEVSEYQSSMKDIMSKRDNLFNKLFDTSGFTSNSKQKDANGNDADVFSLADPNEAYKKLLKYKQSLEKLRAREVGDDVLEWIKGLDQETAQNTMDVLDHMSDSQLSSYKNGFEKYKSEAMTMADEAYASDIDKLNKGFIEKVDGLLAELPGKAEVDGANTVAGYINGLKSKESDLSSAVTEFTDSIINKIKENLDIHSPSGEAEDLGAYTAKGYMKGFTAENMSDAVDNFTSSFLTKLAQKDPAIRAAMEDTFTGNMAAVLGNMENLANTSLNNIASALSGKIPALPDVTKLSLPSSSAISGASGDSELSVISAKLDKLDTIVSLIQSITVLSANGQRIKLELELNGRLTADMNSFVAVIAQKFNNVSIQTGKKVFSY